MAIDVPVAIILNATFLNWLGTVRTANGDTMDQNMACEHATPILEIMSMM